MIYLISDVHGNIEGLKKALFEAKITDAFGNRQMPRKNKVIAIGDLANCVAGSQEGDRACLELVGPIIDYLIVGNHEFGYFDRDNDFAGFHHYEGIHRKLWELRQSDLIIPAYLYGKTLVTHAGVTKQMLSVPMKPREIYEAISYHWDKHNYKHSWFSTIGQTRGGRSPYGGILWCDFHNEFQPTKFPQIVGHSAVGRNVKMKGNALCIDVGAKDPNTQPFILEVR